MDAPKIYQQLKKAFSSTLILVLIPSVLSFSQSSTNCADAVTQLQNYAAQVNQVYLYQYWTAIPNQWCPAVNGYGLANDPAMVQYCRYQWYYQLNVWYYQQANYVNTLYTQIVKGCTTQSMSESSRPAPKVKKGAEVNNEINTNEIEDLTADVDESKAVRITIPKTASGYKRN